ncbi:kinase-like domain-containing protein, partial [Sparassis latifolia]
QITESLAVKYGRSVSELEARNMLYVLERTSIPIPDVHLVFKQGNITYIIMQFIHGPTVQNCWHMLDASQRHSVASQLVRYIDDLHCSSVSAPSNKPGPLDGGKCEGPWFTFYGAGPFASYEELVTWLNRKEVLSQTKSTNSFTTDRPLVFTHQDLSPRNLILDDNDKLWVIDWELAGWYP